MELSNLQRENIFNELDEMFTKIFELLEDNDIDANFDDGALASIFDDSERIYETIKENI